MDTSSQEVLSPFRTTETAGRLPMSHRYDLCTVLLTCLLAAAVPAHGAAPPPASTETRPLPARAGWWGKNDAKPQPAAVAWESATGSPGTWPSTGTVRGPARGGRSRSRRP